ncbi:hypothetical protein HK098_002206 [Nowakowskiella sp. JEL0407]|nr:hypothetical protein HK098_002206 [Nowakowskiella sp. JEL0407]
MGNAASADSENSDGHVTPLPGPVALRLATPSPTDASFHPSPPHFINNKFIADHSTLTSNPSADGVSHITAPLVAPSPIVGSPLIASDQYAQSTLMQRMSGKTKGVHLHGSFYTISLTKQFLKDGDSLSIENIRKKSPLGAPNNDNIEKGIESLQIGSSSSDASYKNTSKIIHPFGPSGNLALAPIGIREEKKNTIPIILGWNGGGKVVFVTGTFNNWGKRIRLNKSSTDFTIVVDVPPGTHRFKFIVDNEWKCSDDYSIASESDGNLVNYLEVVDEHGDSLKDGLDHLASLGDTPPPLPDSPVGSYSSEIPSYLLNPNAQSQDKSSKSAFPTEPPPQLPPHLEKVLLNSNQIAKDDASVLPVPNHVSLNHLYACSIRDGVMALSCTTRYKKKYVTTVLYKPVFG